ncbi:TonB-linked outer membrane protein, SusC/RagA family [Parapedobacter indicus]|uniref:TonB-linked outer membrane protein, SusC/RagA family n=2 Tax=Parapedobacter indicus TaxID=1477437 RepID=A0A1I3IAV4_9SPHI|nr:TonB-linked SusC/RagA family outer membrane protein [Parapedobacter indicus]SFI44913.1 TonB-linked outer membrane protein, SusC/RagA family [Parapedobacter indicus]
MLVTPLSRTKANEQISLLFLVMKITTALLLLGALHVSARSLSQTITLDAKDKPIKQIFEAIYEQTQFGVIYNDQKINPNQKVTVVANDMPLEAFLDELLGPRDLFYRIKEQTIFVRTKSSDRKAYEPSVSVARLQRTVGGLVTDEQGNPLEGVTVTLAGTSSAVTTDSGGKYHLILPDNGNILVFTIVGFERIEVAIGSESTINVVLKASVSDLDEVVVVGYGLQKRANVTGSVATVKGEVLKRNPAASTLNTLAGRLPGLVIKQTSGQPGFDASRFNIRNFGAALVIVDGVEQSFNNINPEEIESISVLKDASAAIYGARAGNGVILVTTKRGTSGTPTISVNSVVTGQSFTNFPEPVNAWRYATLYREAQINAGIPDPQFKFSEADIEKYRAGTDPQYPNTDWMGIIMKKLALQQQHNLSISGGTDKTKYYTFLNYLDQDGMFKGGNTGYSRYNVRSNLDIAVTSAITVSLDLSGIKEIVNQSSRPASEEWFWMDFFDSRPTAPASYPDPTKVPNISPGPYNAIINTHEDIGGYAKGVKSYYNGALTVNYNLKQIEGLDFRLKVNYYNQTIEQKNWRKQAQIWNYDYGANAYSLHGTSEPTQLTQAYDDNQIITGQLSANYQRTFNEQHAVNGLLLFEAIDYGGKNFSAFRQYYISTAIDQLFAGGTLDQRSNGSASQSGRKSLVGRINYGFQNKYLAEATVRYDGSPNFPADKRWGLFPSVSLGWRMSEEAFIKDHVSWIDHLKLRGGISQTGYDNVSAYQYLTGFRFSGIYVVDGDEVPALVTTGLPNPNITWETMTLSNLGLELSVLGGKIYTEADFFKRLREDMLGSRVASLPNTFGASLPSENINSQVTKGFEIQLGSRGTSGDFRYDVSVNMSLSKSWWNHFDEVTYSDPDEIRIMKKTGQRTDIGFGYKSDGLFTTQTEIDDLPYDIDGQANGTLRPGDIKIVDLNNDGKIDWRDQMVINNGGTPHIMYGLNMDFQYKNFDFSLLFQGAANYTVMLQAGNINIDSERSPMMVIWNERWTPENNDANAIIPRQKLGQSTNNWNSDFWNRDASYLRLKNLSFGYTFDAKMVQSIGIKGLRIYFAGVNLLTLNPLGKYGLDPESPDATRGWTYPIQKTYSLGLNLTL